ncbi:MAG: hypothetical protein SWK90_15180 [Chloroflexota bacterium]|nr:hypothetical protein [Chloroflexota bacterium]
MAKKSRRVRKKGRRVRLSPAQMIQPEIGEEVAASLIAAQARSVPEVSDLREEYRYVVADLKRIGIIAVAMLAILIALALLLP